MEGTGAGGGHDQVCMWRSSLWEEGEAKSRNIPGKGHEVWIGQGRGQRAGVGICGAETAELGVCWGLERGRKPECSLASQLGEAPVAK